MEEGLKEQSNSKNQVTGQYISLKDFLGEMNELQGRTKWAGIKLSQEGKKSHAFGEKKLPFLCESSGWFWGECNVIFTLWLSVWNNIRSIYANFLKLVAAREFALISLPLPPLAFLKLQCFQKTEGEREGDRMPSYKAFPPRVLGKKGFD